MKAILRCLSRSASLGRSMLLLGLWSLSATLHAGDPRLNSITPQGGQLGTEVDVVLDCPRYGDPQEVILSRPGITIKEIKPGKQTRLHVKLQIAEDCPLGRHPLRVRTDSGLSNLLTFHVGALPETTEQEPNNSAEAAQAVELGSVVNGFVETEDTDCYRVELTEGERLSVEVEGLRLGRTFFDPAIEVYDDQQQLVASCDDAALTHQDSFVSLAAPKTGVYTIAVREAAQRGNGACTYRLHLGRFPRPAAVYPPGGRPGEELKLTWLGDGLGPREETVKLPEGPQADQFLFPQDDQGVAPSGVPIRVVDLPRTMEQEPNDKRKEATAAEAPGVFTGVVQAEDDADLFQFVAKKGDVLDARVFARSLGAPLDPVIRILDPKGKRVAGNDDDQGQPDSYVRFTAQTDGEHLIEIKDHLGRGAAGYLYWIELTKPQPHVEVKVEELRRYFATTIDVPQAGQTAAVFTVTRRDGAPEAKLQLSDLPAGVEAIVPDLPANFNRTPIVFVAAEEAALGGSLANIALNKDQVPTRFEQQTWLVRGANNRDVWSYFDDRLPIAVTKRVPFSIEIVAPKSPLVQSGSKELKIVAKRDEGFEESIKVHLLYNPPGVSSNRSLSIRKGESEAVIPITANGNAQVDQWPIAVLGETNIQGRIVTATRFVPLTVAKSFVKLSFPVVTTQQATPVEFIVGVEQLAPFEGEATIELLGLPPGVTAKPQSFTKEEDQAVFPLEVAADARLGWHRNVSCQVVVTVDGEPVTYNQGNGQLRIDPVPTDNKSQAATKEKSSAEEDA